jgi:small subunit ribosomal protein S20
LANTKSSIKEIRVAEARHERNKMVRSELKTSARKAQQLVAGADRDAAKSSVQANVSDLDQAVSRGIVHRNTAARSKSRLEKKLNKANAPKTA